MNTTRRTFIGGAAAFAALHEGLAAPVNGGSVFEKGGKASDFLMCRRLHLDICGRIPTREEVEEYVKSKDSRKLEHLVDKLLDSEDFADYWAMRFCDILRVKSEFPINLWPNAVYVYHRRIRQAVVDDEPWPEFARSLLCARGSNFRVPEANFLRSTPVHTPDVLPEALSELATNTFLLEPSPKYAKYFARVQIKKTKEWKEEVVSLKDGPAESVPEGFLDELEGPLASKFHSAPVKRVHYWIYGTLPKAGVEGTLTACFRQGGFRLKPLLRRVFNASEYKASPMRGKFPPRRLDAEVLDDAICSLTGMQRSFESIAPEPFSYLPPARKSVLVEDGSITSAFLMLFGRPARDTGFLEERNNQVTAKQRLYLYNSGRLWNAIGQMVESEACKDLDHRAFIEDVFMRFLSRPPVKSELDFLDKKNNVSARDVAWHVMNSREFIYRI